MTNADPGACAILCCHAMRTAQAFVYLEMCMSRACLCSRSRLHKPGTRGFSLWPSRFRTQGLLACSTLPGRAVSPVPLFPINRLFDWLVSVINSSICADSNSWTAFIGSKAHPATGPPEKQLDPGWREGLWVTCVPLSSSFLLSASVLIHLGVW